MTSLVNTEVFTITSMPSCCGSCHNASWWTQLDDEHQLICECHGSRYVRYDMYCNKHSDMNNNITKKEWGSAK